MTRIPVKSEEDELRKALQNLADAFGTSAATGAPPAINDPALIAACELLYPTPTRGVVQ